MKKFAVSLASSLVLAAMLTACGGGSDDSGSTTPPPTPPVTPAPELAQDYCYTMSTSMGDITLAIDATNTPITGENFKQYVDTGFYDGLIFHRVVRQFVVQGGGFTPDLVQKETRDPIENEASVGISNLRGTIAMARTSAPNSATSQFYINTIDNVNLDQEHALDGVGYAVFGKVIDGIEIVDQIDIVDTNNDVPVEVIVINSIAEMTCPAT